MATHKPFILNNSNNDQFAKSMQADKEQNELIKQWVPKVRTALKGSAGRFKNGKVKPFILRRKGSQEEHKLVNSINAQTRQSFGVVNCVSFKFERHGVFVYKGVGKGSGRVPQDWFNSVLEQNIPELANRLADIRADAVLNDVGMKII